MRRGSLLVALNVISAGAIHQRHHKADSIPASQWLKWLQLPWPKDGEDVVVQVRGRELATGWSTRKSYVWCLPALPSKKP